MNQETLKNERESLERIHTFSLKEPVDFNLTDDPQSKASKLNMSQGSGLGGINRARNISAGSRDSSTSSNKSCSHYVPEKVSIFEKQIKHTATIVRELISIQTEFGQVSELSF